MSLDQTKTVNQLQVLWIPKPQLESAKHSTSICVPILVLARLREEDEACLLTVAKVVPLTTKLAVIDYFPCSLVRLTVERAYKQFSIWHMIDVPSVPEFGITGCRIPRKDRKSVV